MVDIVKYLSDNRIIGDLIAREKYSFVDGKLIASIVDDVMAIVKEAAAKQEESPVTSYNSSSLPRCFYSVGSSCTAKFVQSCNRDFDSCEYRIRH